MTTALGHRYSPHWYGRPPHMSSEDLGIWQRWRHTILSDTVGLYFDVAVGDPDPAPRWYDEKLRAGWYRLNQRRIDVVADQGHQVLLIELRFMATPNAVGRLLAYGMLWAADDPLRIPLRLVLVTNDDRRDMRELCAVVGIDYQVA